MVGELNTKTTTCQTPPQYEDHSIKKVNFAQELFMVAPFSKKIK